MPTDPTPVPSAGPSAASWADPWAPRYGHSDPRQGRYRGADVDDDDDRWDRRGGDRYRDDDPYRGGDDRGRSRKRSLLGELFEGFGD